MLGYITGYGTVQEMSESFSQRHGLAGPPPGTLLRDEVPPGFRIFLLDDLHNYFSEDELRKVVCDVLQEWPDLSMPPHFDCKKHIKKCEWFRIHEIIEGTYKVVYERSWRSNPGAASMLAKAINKAFIEQNIGWQLVNGKVITRGDGLFEGTVKGALTALEEDQKPTSAGHLGSAISALSVRPKPNTSGAVAHAASAVECVLGEITGEAMTLGKYLDKHSALFHPALKKGLAGIYGYASDEGARHGKEGTEPALEEAAFVVATCAAVCTLLVRKHSK
jgi:hypothetical protein